MQLKFNNRVLQVLNLLLQFEFPLLSRRGYYQIVLYKSICAQLQLYLNFSYSQIMKDLSNSDFLLWLDSRLLFMNSKREGGEIFMLKFEE